MSSSSRIALLADHPAYLATLRAWFEAEWPDYYGPAGPGDAAADLEAYSSRDRLPIGLVALEGDRLCGIAVLKADSIATHTHLGPWAAAGLVARERRGRGIGGTLVWAVENLARARGHAAIYCGTSTATRLLERGGWELIERAPYEGKTIGIYRKALR